MNKKCSLSEQVLLIENRKGFKKRRKPTTYVYGKVFANLMEILKMILKKLLISLLFVFAHCYLQAQNLNGIQLDYINENISPSENFYQYCSGKWLDTASLPEGYSRYGFFNEKDMELKESIIAMLDSFDTSNTNQSSRIKKEFFKLYSSGLNQRLAWDENIVAVQLIEIRKIHSIKELSTLMGRFQLIEMNPFFEIFKPKSWELKGIHCLGIKAAVSKSGEMDSLNASSITREIHKKLNSIIENELKRDRQRRKELISASKLRKMISLDWSSFFEAMNINPEKVLITSHEYLKEIGGLFEGYDIEEIKEYMEWRLIEDSRILLESIKVSSSNDSSSNQQSKKHKVSKVILRSMPYIVGELFTDYSLNKEGILEIEKMSKLLQSSYVNQLKKNWWLSEESKSIAINKVLNMQFALGGPEVEIVDEDLDFDENSFIQNIFLARAIETKNYLKRQGKRISDDDWNISALDFNAWYSYEKNIITLPTATISQLFSLDAPKSVNFGLLGTMIAHEMGHAFESQGIRYDENGNYKSWLSKSEKQTFERLSDTLAIYYNSLPITKNKFTNGQKALVETIPDHLSVAVAFDAFMEAQSEGDEKIDGFTPIQLFFISYAQKYRDILSTESTQRYITTYYHPLPEYRVNMPIYFMPGFYKAFCKEQNIHGKSFFSIW